MAEDILALLGEDGPSLLEHRCQTVPASILQLPGPDFVDRIFLASDRNARVVANLQRIYSHGRLGGTGYVSILPVDQGVEHSGGGQLRQESRLTSTRRTSFKPGHGGRLQRRGVDLWRAGHPWPASTLTRSPSWSSSTTTSCSRIPTNTGDQTLYRHRSSGACNMGAAAVGATIYYGSPEQADRQIKSKSPRNAFAQSPRAGNGQPCSGATSAIPLSRSKARTAKPPITHVSADLTGQANHLGVTIQADIIKQKLATKNGGYAALNPKGGFRAFGKYDKRIYTDLTSKATKMLRARTIPIDLCRYQDRQLLHGPHRR
jgi:class I fructose-bisphosphate aldolase